MTTENDTENKTPSELDTVVEVLRQAGFKESPSESENAAQKKTFSEDEVKLLLKEALSQFAGAGPTQPANVAEKTDPSEAEDLELLSEIGIAADDEEAKKFWLNHIKIQRKADAARERKAKELEGRKWVAEVKAYIEESGVDTDLAEELVTGMVAKNNGNPVEIERVKKRIDALKPKPQKVTDVHRVIGMMNLTQEQKDALAKRFPALSLPPSKKEAIEASGVTAGGGTGTPTGSPPVRRTELGTRSPGPASKTPFFDKDATRAKLLEMLGARKR